MIVPSSLSLVPDCQSLEISNRHRSTFKGSESLACGAAVIISLPPPFCLPPSAFGFLPYLIHAGADNPSIQTDVYTVLVSVSLA